MRRVPGGAAGHGALAAVRKWVTDLHRQIVTHRRFQRLVSQRIDLSIGHSRLSMRIAEARAAG